MNRINFDIWEPTPDKPGYVHHVGQRTALEVFEELRQRLESTGYLPDEYFMLSHEWENGRMIPKGTAFFSTVDYGASEGIYIDIYFKWYDEQQKQHITQNFATGKTLGETGADLDRMNLIASAVTKAFNGYGGTYSRYIKIGAEQPGGIIMHLTPEEQRLMIDSLVEHRNRLQEEFTGVEQLLRRVTGSITEFVNEIGSRPLHISDYDMTVLAVEDGNLSAFQELFPKSPDKTGELLILAAGRPGAVGRQMTMLLLENAQGLDGDQYIEASHRAVNIGDLEKVRLLYEQAEHCVADLPEIYHGEVIRHAYGNKGYIASALLKDATPEQISHAPANLLAQAAFRKDDQTAIALVKKGFPANSVADDVITQFGRNSWTVKCLLEQGMQVSNSNYHALHSCINTGNTDAANILLERGMDFGAYVEWAKANQKHYPIKDEEAFEAMYRAWEATSAPDPVQQGGPTIVGP